MKRSRFLGLKCAACLALAGLLGGCGTGDGENVNTEKPPDAFPVRVEVVRKRVIVDRVILPCTAEPYEAVKVSAEVAARVTKMTHDEGERVKVGEVLFLCDTERLQAELARAEAAHHLALASHKRIEELAKSKYGQATAEQLDRARAERDVAKANLAVARITLERASIRSPLDGYLEHRYIDVGEYVDVGTPVADIVQVDKLKVYVEVPERDANYVRPGDRVVLHFGFNGEGDFPGVIDNVNRVGDAITRTYRTRIIVDNKDELIRAGMIGSTILVRGKPHEGISISLDSVIARKGTRFVVVEENGKAVIREVELGTFDGQRVEVTKGLDVGDRLIVAGQRRVSEGDLVKVVTVPETDASLEQVN